MARYPTGLLEEELKNKVAADWFAAYDTTRIIGKVDFCVAIPATELGLFEAENALWAEAKAGVRKDIHESFVQLILTIGRARTFDAERPPIFLGAFDAEKIELTAKATGFMPGTTQYIWMYSKEKDGVYEELKAPQVRNFVPSRAGFYKVKATDRVYSCESEPVEAGLKTTDCQPVEIICTDRDYVCKDSKTILKSSLIGNEYKYKNRKC